ncbi:metal-dependent hydrolase [Massilia sp. H6]|uniref:metal-dependent hydrolase n=1 Tax=Massilia sp. H6 TaxID=2970464 RepID=UPI002169EFE7|nr:metal-dependent hydrolase [Massilia sp. H6]UVW27409.1 metal-dependent hydrolase [Massilia sp. H6]
MTHSLVGLALGELVDRALPAPVEPAHAKLRRRVLLATGLLASNFPDLDLVLTPLLAAPLGYLIHHRGHTHTLLYALPQVALLLVLAWLLWPGARRLMRSDQLARRAVLGTALLGMLLHLLFDALNAYGLHPFYPFDARWLYGDVVFIVEPVFWTALGVGLALCARTRLAGRLVLGFFCAMPPLLAGLGLLQWGSLAALALIALLVAAASLRAGARAGLFAAIAVCVGFVGIQTVAGQLAHSQASAALAQVAPGSRVLDIPLSPFPANPLCWSFITISEGPDDGSYDIRVGVLSLAPGIAPVAHCPARFGGEPAARSPRLAWKSDETGSLAALRRLQRSNCHLDAWLRFARAPSLLGGNATDLRFSPPGQPNFSTLPYAERAGQPCPAPVAQWGYPRADLLAPAPAIE